MEQPTNLMMIVGVMMLDRKPDIAKVRRAIKSRFLAFRRFRCRTVQDASGAWWEEDEAFDINFHVQRVALPGAGGKAELQDLVSELASTPLDFDRPLWQFHLVDNYAGGGALITRIHHCYADGIALIQVMLSMTDTSAEASLTLPAETIDEPSRGDADFWEQILKPVTGALGGAAQLGRGLLGQGAVANTQAAAEALQGVARKGMDFAGELARLVTMGRDSETRFKGALGTRKRAAWADPLPLAEVKAVGKAFGCSINDVLLSMATGALRDYLIDKGDAADGLDIRAVVPVNLRPLDQGKNLGNHFGLVFLELPIGMAHPLERLYEVRRRMMALKGSYQPIIALGLLNAVGYGPKALQEQVTGLLGSSASAVMTNVPGPAQPLYFAGRRIDEIEFWVPQSGSIGMGVSILSYDGRIQFGIITDAGLVPDPDAIVERFAYEFEQLLWITLMSPWGEEAASQVEAAEAGRSTDAVPAQAGNQSPSTKKKIPKRFRNL
jgi:WS/DGAT/MGAT family acyltransferase